MRIDVFTGFPDLVDDFASASILGRARRAGLLDLRVHDLRVWAPPPRHSLDDTPFGGGPGMVMTPGPIFRAVEEISPPRPLLLLGPGGRRFDQHLAAALASGGELGDLMAHGRRAPSADSGSPTGDGTARTADRGSPTGEEAVRSGDAAETGEGGSGLGEPVGFSLLCGRYEGIDQRVADHLVDGELSIGDYVLAGGEVAALVVVEAVARLVPGVLGNRLSAEEESFTAGLLEYPHYTQPPLFRQWPVPEVLRSGDHGRIAAWRRTAALRRTMERRPDLLEARGGLHDEDARLLGKLTPGEGSDVPW